MQAPLDRADQDRRTTPEVRIDKIRAAAYRLPADDADADGVPAWDALTLIAVHAEGGGSKGFGYSYADPAAAVLVNETLAAAVTGGDALAPQAAWDTLRQRLRNGGPAGIGACAASAVDCALWDLKAKLLDVSLAGLLGRVRPDVRAYGSGSATSYDEAHLTSQLAGWTGAGMNAVKIRIGGGGIRDLGQVEIARDAVGRDIDLFVDAGGTYTAKQALGYARRFADHGVTWFEEPVSSDDVEGLRLVRQGGPPGMAIAAGAYTWSPLDVRRLLEAGAVDVVQADATRCGGTTGFLHIAALCEAFQTPLSALSAPSLHATLCSAVGRAVHAEYHQDHARLESLLLDGAVQVRNGRLTPDASAPGWGLTLKQADAEPHRVA